jgi:putative ABC transport system substrate-binding protein
MSDLRRREFISVLGGAVAWPCAARALQPGRVRTIGFLGANTSSAGGELTRAFVQRLRELGWVDGHTVAIEFRWSQGRMEKAVEIAAEFVRLKVDLIVASGSNVIAAQKATSVIPIVFAAASDPIGSGYIASLARPGGNLTGLSLQQGDLAAKRLELLLEVAPALRRFAMIASLASHAVALEADEVQAAARMRGLEVEVVDIRRPEDIAPALLAIKDRAEALYVCAGLLLTTNRVSIAIMASSARLPAIYGIREYVEAGGLMSYGPRLAHLYRGAADYVDKILRGGNPAEIPVQQPTKFELVVNLNTAKALGLTISPTLLARADAVIE